MALITILLAVVSVTTPTLSEPSQRTEPWDREDVTIASVSEFQTSSFLRADERVLLLHHAFIDDKSETLRIYVCADTRMIVLEKAVAQSEIPLVHPVRQVAIYPSSRNLAALMETAISTEIRSLRINTETGGQISFSIRPLIKLAYECMCVFPYDDGLLFTTAVQEDKHMLCGLFYLVSIRFFAPDLNHVEGPVIGGSFSEASTKRDLIYFNPIQVSYPRGMGYDLLGNLHGDHTRRAHYTAALTRAASSY